MNLIDKMPEWSRAFGTEGFFCPTNSKGHCAACGLSLGDEAYRLPGRASWFCSIACVEAELFGGPHCRWCGKGMEKPYTSLDSRLCSEGCTASYKAHVLGDRKAMLGSGKRLRLWAARNAPAHMDLEGRRCANPRCRKDRGKYPATLDHLRPGSLYCSESCKKQAQRSPSRHFSPSTRRINIGFSRDTFGVKPLGVIPGASASQKAFQAVSG
jgi:hypothetical protein